MQDSEDRSGGLRQHSLLSLAPKETESAGPANSGPNATHHAAAAEPPPFVRHQMARARRDASPAPRVDRRAKVANSLMRHPSDDVNRPSNPSFPDAEETAAKPARLNDFLDGLRARLPWNTVGEPDAAEREIGASETGEYPVQLGDAPLSAPPSTPMAEAPEPARITTGAPVAERAKPAIVDLPDTGFDDHGETTRPDPQYWQPLIDPAKVIAGVMNSKRLIAAFTIVGALLGVYAAVSTPKKYESNAEVLVDPRNLNLTEQSLTDPGLSTEATLAIVENQAKVITSANAINKVVDELHLTEDPEFNGSGHGGIGAFVADLRALLSGGGKKEGDVKRQIAAQNLAKSIDVEREGKTFIVKVSAKTNDPEKSALVANTVVKVFEQTSSQLQEKTATRAANELTSRLAELRSGVELAERKVAAFRASHDLVDAQGKLISDDRIVRLNDQLSAATARATELSARAATAKSANIDSVLNGSLPEQVNSPLMAQLRAQYSALKQQGDRIATRLGPRHPQRQAIEAQLAGARAQIQAELNRIVASIGIDLKRAQDLQRNLTSQLTEMKEKHATINGDLVTLHELERDAKAKRDVYESYLLRARQTDEQKDISTANISVISTAFPPLNPEGPSRSVISLVGALLGLLLGIGIGAARGTWASLRENVDSEPGKKRASKGARTLHVPPNAKRPPAPQAPAPAPEVHRAAESPLPVGAPAAPAPATAAEQPSGLSSMEEVRESLKQFRQAIRDLAESRSQENPKS
ncbi:MAG: succinoglycan biosynthesis protein exop [Rhizobiaceae bacterium]|nr:MAG: succinoglycan biosynthesis protein exop [Rhizobiaceae bacterium]